MECVAQVVGTAAEDVGKADQQRQAQALGPGLFGDLGECDGLALAAPGRAREQPAVVIDIEEPFGPGRNRVTAARGVDRVLCHAEPSVRGSTALYVPSHR